MFLINFIKKKLYGSNKINKKLDFKDVLLVPQHSLLKSRKKVSLERNFYFPNSKRRWVGIPLVVSNMDTTGTIEIAEELQKYKILTCLHKYYTKEDILDCKLDTNYFSISTGINDNDLKNLDEILSEKKDIKFICIDVANGYMQYFIDRCKLIREKYPDKVLIAGNVVTPEQIERINESKIDIIKLGIGSGSVCTTRLKTGIGCPQMSVILDCERKCKELGIYLMSDGGIKYPGDLGKAFVGGADFVMCGSVFAGHTESAGKVITEIINEKKVKYKIFYGMSSRKAMIKHTGKMNKYRTEEGKVVKMKYRGSVNGTVEDFLGGLRSTMTYLGCKNIKNLYRKTNFIRVNQQVSDTFSKRSEI